jgi:Mn2+/Fe2+ NRAMP family transporter
LTTVLGPGVLMAAAAIGASHLIQSTRAGANFGFQLLWLAVLANVMKYPFFEFGQRYAAATGETMLHGYRRLGVAYVGVFLVVSCITMIVSIAALTFITAGLAEHLLGVSFGAYSAFWWSLVIVAVCNGILFFGRYRALDMVTKVIVAILGITAIVAAFAAFAQRQPLPAEFEPTSPWTLVSLPFLIALMGWMPAPVELSVWPGVWIKEREEQTGFRPTLREALWDFNIGYVATIILAAAFLSLGALVMHGSDITFSGNGVVFAGQLVDLFRHSIGAWSGPVVAVAAFTCMFSTTLTVLDGYPRSNAIAALLTFDRRYRSVSGLFWVMNIVSSITALVVIAFFARSLKTMLDVATTVAFLAAPLFAALNLKLMLSAHVPREYRPRTWLVALAWIGFVFLLGFSGVYLLNLVGMIG